MKIQIKKRDSDETIYEMESNIIKRFALREAIENAVKDNMDFTEADFSNANLRDADLRNGKFHKANFTRANLSNADLSNADLSKANLSNARFSLTNLSNANISGAKLSALYFHTKVTKEQIKYITEKADLFEIVECPGV